MDCGRIHRTRAVHTHTHTHTPLHTGTFPCIVFCFFLFCVFWREFYWWYQRYWIGLAVQLEGFLATLSLLARNSKRQKEALAWLLVLAVSTSCGNVDGRLRWESHVLAVQSCCGNNCKHARHCALFLRDFDYRLRRYLQKLLN